MGSAVTHVAACNPATTTNGRRGRVARPPEHREPGIAFPARPHNRPTTADDRVVNDAVVNDHGDGHRPGV